MARLGTFDDELNTVGLFDCLLILGWFDEDLIDVAAAQQQKPPPMIVRLQAVHRAQL